MFVVVADDGRVPRGRPGAAARGHEQKAALIQEGEVGAKSGFFYGRPLVAFPMRHRVCVVLDGLALGHLTAPAQVASDLPDMRGMAADAELHLNHRGDALEGPQLVGKAIGAGPVHQQLYQVLALLVGQFARRPRHRLGGQGSVAPLPPSRPPLIHRAYRRLHPARHLAQAQPLLKQRHRAAAPSF
jgi:hypothetical protein